MLRLRPFLSTHGRPAASFVALWLFGIATTILLVALWGRSVAVDRDTLSESAEAVIASGYVHDRVEAWVGEALATTASATPDSLTPVAEAVVADPRVAASLDRAVGSVVDAALSPEAGDATIDVAAVLEVAVPIAVRELEAAGHSVDPASFGSALAAAPTIVLAEDGIDEVVAARVTATTLLTQAVLLGAALMLASGGVAVALSEDRPTQLRDLGTRVALSGLGFAIFLRAGAWATDPAAGRSPVAAGGSVILGSNGQVPLVVAGVALVVVVVAAAVVVRRRRNAPDREALTGELPVLERV